MPGATSQAAGDGRCAVAHRATAAEATVAAVATEWGGAPLRTAGYGPGRRGVLCLNGFKPV